MCCSVIECFCPDRAFHSVPFTIVFGPWPSLTSSGHRIPFCRLHGRLRPPGNMRRLHFPADSTLKRGLLASCRDRCYSPLIYTRPPFICPKNSSSRAVHKCWRDWADFIDGSVWDYNASPTWLFSCFENNASRCSTQSFCCFCLSLVNELEETGRRQTQLSGLPHNGFPEWDSTSVPCRRLTQAAFWETGEVNKGYDYCPCFHP